MAAGCRVTVSRPSHIHEPLEEILEQLTHDWAGDIEFIEETDERLCKAILTGQVARLRYAKPDRVPESVRRAALEAHIHIADTPVSSHGRIELLWYVEEQSISFDYHRYGNLGVRASEPRGEAL